MPHPLTLAPWQVQLRQRLDHAASPSGSPTRATEAGDTGQPAPSYTEDWFHGLCLALLRWRPRCPGVPRLTVLRDYEAWLRRLWRLHRGGYSNRASARALEVTEGDVRYHLKHGPEHVSRLTERLFNLKRGVRNAIYSSRLQSPKQRAYIQHLANLLGVQVPPAWLTYGKRHAGALISKLVSRLRYRNQSGNANVARP